MRLARRILTLLLLALSLCCWSDEVAAQLPWDGWYGPLADGIMEFRFGMGRQDAREVATRRNVRAATARDKTLRYIGSFLSTEGELILEFSPDATRPGREVLSRIRLDWVGIAGGAGRPKAMFDSLAGLLEERYGPAVHQRDASISDISSGFRDALRVYEGPEAQVQLSLRSAGSGSLRLMMLMISPQLDPSFSR